MMINMLSKRAATAVSLLIIVVLVVEAGAASLALVEAHPFFWGVHPFLSLYELFNSLGVIAKVTPLAVAVLTEAGRLHRVSKVAGSSDTFLIEEREWWLWEEQMCKGSSAWEGCQEIYYAKLEEG
jgi:hypothetical protein